jgi:hypothetical protein
MGALNKSGRHHEHGWQAKRKDQQMFDNATLSLWLTDTVLLALAYCVGRIHARMIIDRAYREDLSDLVHEINIVHHLVYRLCEEKAAAREQAAAENNAPAATAEAGRGIP